MKISQTAKVLKVNIIILFFKYNNVPNCKCNKTYQQLQCIWNILYSFTKNDTPCWYDLNNVTLCLFPVSPDLGGYMLPSIYWVWQSVNTTRFELKMKCSIQMCSLAVLQTEPKAVALPPGAEMQPGKVSLGGEGLINRWINFFVAGMWYRNQESEQYWRGTGVRERDVGLMTFVKIMHMLSTVLGVLYLPTFLTIFLLSHHT